MGKVKDFVGDIKSNIALRKARKAKEKAEEEKHQREMREKRSMKIWGDQEKICPECGSKLKLQKWESYNSNQTTIAYSYHGVHLYRIYYAQCINLKCKWQKRLYEEWER